MPAVTESVRTYTAADVSYTEEYLSRTEYTRSVTKHSAYHECRLGVSVPGCVLRKSPEAAFVSLSLSCWTGNVLEELLVDDGKAPLSRPRKESLTFFLWHTRAAA